MACQNCNNPTQPVAVSVLGCPNCGSGCSDNGCGSIVDTSCIVYTGPNLTCIGADTNMCLEIILQKIDAQVCAVTGDYSGYNLGCLRSTYNINTAQDFAESISNYVCNIRSDFDTFVTDTYPAGILNLQTQINGINVPGITSCASVGILNTDTLFDVLDKLAISQCLTIEGIDDIVNADWSSCYTVITPPTTLKDAFNVVLSQICQTKALGGATLPTFNNVGTCLSTPTATDSLVDTVTKIRTRLCQLPTFAAANLNLSTCVQFSGASTLEDVIDAQNSAIDQVSQDAITQTTTDFILTQVDPFQPCLGMKLALNSSIVDRNVALNGADITPGTLLDKVAAGTNITLDFGILNAGKLTISSSAGAVADEKVKATATDPTAGFLNTKLTGGTNGGITIGVSASSPSLLAVAPSVNFEALINAIFDEIEDNETLKARLCSIISTCPSPCDPPTNVQVTYVP